MCTDLYLPDTTMLQYYLRKSLLDSHIYILAKFRMSAHNLLIEEGRYSVDLPREHRLCRFCSLNDIEDEFHFILVCPLYGNLRVMYLKRYYYINPSMFKLVQILSVKNKKMLSNMAKYLIKAMRIRSTH